MKRKGFTLIELLAVIVVLAIIALIATPIVMNVIKNVQMGAAERSADNYVKAVDTLIATKQLDGEKIADGSYEITSTGKLTIDGKEHEVEISGTKPNGGIIKIENGQVVKNESSITMGDYTVTYEDGKAKAEEAKKLVTLSNVCSANTTKATALVWNNQTDPSEAASWSRKEVGLLASDGDAYAPGVTYTCNFIDDSEENNMIFFVLSSTENEVTLIAGNNLTYSTWNADIQDVSNHKDESEDKQAVGAKTALSNAVSTWGKLDDAQKATIKLPTKEQIEGAYSGTMPTWLYSFTSTPISRYDEGYWTSTPFSNASDSAWSVYIYTSGVQHHLNKDAVIIPHGIRPVITLSKSNI